MPNFDLSGTALAAWYSQPLGQELATLETEQLQTAITQLPAYHALQLGSLNLLPPDRRFIYFDSHPSPTIKNHQTLGAHVQLPFRDGSFELVILPHVLEFETAPLTVLNESWRVLAPNGHLAILSFNPWSVWGLRRLFATRWATAPWNSRFHSAEKLQRQLRDLNATIILEKSFFHHLPINSKTFMARTRWLEKTLALLLPDMGGVYLIVAQKRIAPLTLIKPRWHWQSVFSHPNPLPQAGEGTLAGRVRTRTRK